jgi:glyoxylase-like metal-dependent hydrolase (beta-lactamase superfamily II)/rhodanese-related sulfurtransferase
MIIEQIYTGCLAQGAYYIESSGEAVVIDPLREVGPYLERAHKSNARIRYVFETHFHADFVSGHLDLARHSGGTIVFGPAATPAFDAHVAKDKEILQVGAVSFEVIHTPGHTMESTCYLLRNEEGKPVALFTGDTLFIGDVGRPDLAQKVSADLDEEKLAGLLFDSLRHKIMPLSDEIIVYPAHGAGSACGKKMSKETYDTLGNQKKTNYALNPNLTREEFIHEVLTGLTPPPSYFPQNVLMNIKGYDSFHDVLKRGTRALEPAEFEAVANETDALILDTRDADIFSKGFIPNSINIGIDGSFAPWVGTLIPDVKQTLLLITGPGREEETVTRLARVGYDHAIGYLKGGFVAWKSSGYETDQIRRIHANELAEYLKSTPDIPVIDVRKKSEFESEHIVNAINAPLDYLNENMAMIPKTKTAFVHCAGGYRSMIFISALRARGYDQLIDVRGGFSAIKESGLFHITDYVCPSTLL